MFCCIKTRESDATFLLHGGCKMILPSSGEVAAVHRQRTTCPILASCGQYKAARPVISVPTTVVQDGSRWNMLVEAYLEDCILPHMPKSRNGSKNEGFETAYGYGHSALATSHVWLDKHRSTQGFLLHRLTNTKWAENYPLT